MGGRKQATPSEVALGNGNAMPDSLEVLERMKRDTVARCRSSTRVYRNFSVGGDEYRNSYDKSLILTVLTSNYESKSSAKP